VHQLKAGDPFKARTKLDDKQYMEEQYLTEDKSSYEIASLLEVGQQAVLSALHKHNIKIKTAHDYSNKKTIGSYHNTIIKWLDDNRINHTSCYILKSSWNRKNKYWELDEYLPDHKLFIEIQGEFWHGILPRSRSYTHIRNKMWSDLWKYLTIMRDLPDHKVLYLTDNNTNIEVLRKTLKIDSVSRTSAPYNTLNIDVKLIKPSDARVFLKENHYLGTTNGTFYGAYVNDVLMLVCTISNPTRQNIKSSIGKCRELTRLAVKDGAPTNIISYSFSRIAKLEVCMGTTSIVTFADPTPYRKNQHSGAVYRACNFKYVGSTAWNYCYCDNENIYHKKTIYNRAKKVGLKEKEYVNQNGLYKLPEWPKLKFEIILK